MIFEDL